MQEETRKSLFSVVQRLSKDLSDGELLDMFVQNSDEQTFTNVIAGLTDCTPKLDAGISKVINKLQAEVNSIVAHIEDYKEIHNEREFVIWTNKLEHFIQYVELSGYGCRKNSNDSRYTIYSKLSLEGLNDD